VQIKILCFKNVNERRKTKQKNERKKEKQEAVKMSTDNRLMTATLGDTVSYAAVDRLQMRDGERTAICVLSKDILTARTHYVDEKKTKIYCNGGECCELFGRPSIHYILMILHYKTDSQGKIDLNGGYKVKSLPLGFTQYNALIAIDNICGDITKIDLMVQCDDQKYKKYQFFQFGERQYPKIAGISQSLKDDVMYFKQHIANSVAMKISPERLMSWLSSKDEASAPRPLPFGAHSNEAPAVARLIERNEGDRLSPEDEAKIADDIESIFA